MKRMRIPGSDECRFWKRVLPTSADACWSFIGCKNKWGQQMTHFRKKLVLVTRLMYTFTKGPIPDGLQVLHTCDNPGCVNPTHLWLGTQADNMRDCGLKQRKQWKLTPEQVREVRQLGKNGVSYKEAAERFGITPQYASRIMRNKQPLMRNKQPYYVP